jgi:signal transduction histidine kinase
MLTSFMPHGHCWLWSPPMLVLQVTTNAAIGLAYLAISLTLAWLVYRIRDIPFRTMYLAFGLFIVACGVTHFLDIWVIWRPDYWVDGGVRAITALASMATAIGLPPLIPKAEALARGAKAAHDRGLALETLVQDLARSDELKTAFFATVSHELRTPLSLILAPTERLLSQGGLPPEVARELEIVRRNAHTLLRHVEDLLDVAKLEAGQTAPEYAQVDLAALVRQATGNFESLASERNVRVRLELPESLPAELDPRKLERLLLSLLSNAFRVTPEGGQVRLTLSAREGTATLQVADEGPPIPEDEREVALERFRQLVELHKGTLRVEQDTEGGALFRICLPLSAPEGAQVRTEVPAIARRLVETPLEGPAVEPAPNDKPQVLVVEDNAELRRFLVKDLSSRYRVQQARHGREGLQLAMASPPDLVVTDLMMPEMSGEELVRTLRSAGHTVPVLVLSALSDGEQRITLLKAGADDYLIKPFHLEELRTRVHRMIEAKRAREVLQRELVGREGTLAELSHQLVDRSRELERASQLKTAFLRMITHELRTPVHVLQLQFALMQRDPSRAASLAPKQQRSLDRLTEMIDALLLHARLEAGALQPVWERVDLGQLAREVVAASTPEAEEHGLELQLEGEGAEIEVDRKLLQLALQNLVSNAVKFTPTGRVVVRLRQSADEHLVEVEDTGPGIAPEDQLRIFTPFEHVADAAHKHVRGVGLGLSLVQEFVAALGGYVRLLSAPGQGSTFIVGLPRRDV